MTLSWNEIRHRALAFSEEYKGATRENAETQSFYNDLFNVFGISRRRMASFEEPVKKLGDRRGRIDLFWRGVLLVEQKSSGRDLDAAYTQALDYFPHLREEDLPRYVLISDFQRFELYDLETNHIQKFSLADLHKNVEYFGFIAGHPKREFRHQDELSIDASERMGKLHDMLKDVGYDGHDLELLLVRLLFCLFADDTGIFEKGTFRAYLEDRTSVDGSDLGLHLAMLFQTLNSHPDRRQKSLDDELASFPYINGRLFSENTSIPAFDSIMRQALIHACSFRWSQISPAIFGSLFQSVMETGRRRERGAHYTTESNIMKILRPLCLDELQADFEKAKSNKLKLAQFHDRLANLRFLDPACGCGNFLIIAYRELRELEIKVLKLLHNSDQQLLDASHLSRIDVDAFYGIEIEEFPARIAEVALWLMDHQMNMRLSAEFGVYYARLPLRKSAHIHYENALRVDWKAIVDPTELSYILGNPPFVGKQYRTDEQNADMAVVFSTMKTSGVLDYVTAWFVQAARYIQGTSIKCAFVSTNSITQGEQVGILWTYLFNHYNIKIHFSHRTFVWGSEATRKAAVHCVVIGFGTKESARKILYDYATPLSDPYEATVTNISPYLIEGDNSLIVKRSKPICNVPEIVFGNMPNDAGHLLLTDDERQTLLDAEPAAEKFIRPLLGAHEFINNIPRYCLWLTDAKPEELRAMPHVMDRIERVRAYRRNSSRKTTVELANTPSLFGEIRQPDTDYLLIPSVSSESRMYVPIAIMNNATIATNLCLIIPDARTYHFGILTSTMHMAWLRQIGGRLKSDYRYSAGIAYNNFPWPRDPSDRQICDINKHAVDVLNVRKEYPGSSMADLYHPLTMPQSLLKAHKHLDAAVDAAYRSQPFPTERTRIEYLFRLYSDITAPIASPPSERKAKPLRKAA